MESTNTVQKTPLSRMRSFNGRDLSGLGLGVYLMAVLPLLTGFAILYDRDIQIAITLHLPSFSHYYLKVHLQVVQIMIKLVISV